MWNGLRIFCVVLGLVSQYVPASICAAIVVVLAGALTNLHIETLPFNNPLENSVRGGIYAAVGWTAFARHAHSHHLPTNLNIYTSIRPLRVFRA